MRIRNLAAGGLLAMSAITAGTIVSAGTASAATCTTTHTYTHKTTSLGSQSWEWVTRTACGKDYQRREKLISDSYTGSHYTEIVVRDEMNYPHYVEQTWKDAFSKKGVETRTYVRKTG